MGWGAKVSLEVKASMHVPEEGALVGGLGACPPEKFAKLGILRSILGRF